MVNSKKEKFLEKVEPAEDVTDVVKSMYEYKVKGYDSYTLLTLMNLNKSGEVKHDSYNSFMKTTYTQWYDYVCQLDPRRYTGATREAILKIKSDPSLNPANMSEEDCRDFIFNRYDRDFKGSGLRPLQAQGGEDPLWDDDKALSKDFIHFHPFQKPSQKIECRLYLNVKAENAPKIAELLVKEAYANRKRIYGKFWTRQGRNDTLLLYTSYENVDEAVKLIESVKNAHPELFEGCEKVNPLLGKVNGYIGFGEEPQYQHSSFNSERADAIDEFYDDLFKKVYRMIGNYSGKVSTSQGEELNIKQYVRYRIQESLTDEIREKMKELKLDPNNRELYMIYSEAFNQINGEISPQLDTMVDEIIDSLKNGKKPRVKRVYINYKGRREQIPFSYNIREKLFSVFNVEKIVEENVTEENLKPYFDRHHVSIKNTYLNTESENELENKK